ncbi:MAG: type II toxin-antitoxin system RelB/DinJ family antitoxin [Bacteroidales bacterium]|nr:type II toxin-antitoxin system RelB/DinJ family antitoxin [Bacteroidales bacterium]
MSQTTTMSIRLDSNLKQKFDLLCDEFGLSNTAALMLFIKAVVRESRIPFEIKTDTIEESRRKALLAFEQMREDVAAAGVQEMTLDEINELIREVRYGKK